MTDRRRALLTQKKAERLPSEYQEVEWLKAHGTEFIDTLYKPNINTRIFLAAPVNLSEIPQTSDTSKEPNLFGIFETGKHYFLRMNYGSSTRFICSFALGGAGLRINYSFIDVDEVILSFEMYNENNLLSIQFFGSSTAKYSSQNTVGVFESQYNITLFCQSHNTSGYNRFYSGRISSFKIYENDIPQRDFIPCYRKSDSKPGMYDLVNNVFYTNQGTGEFDIGGDV